MTRISIKGLWSLIKTKNMNNILIFFVNVPVYLYRIIHVVVFVINYHTMPKHFYFKFSTTEGVKICKSKSWFSIFTPRLTHLGIALGQRKYFRQIINKGWRFTMLSSVTFRISDLNIYTNQNKRVGFMF